MKKLFLLLILLIFPINVNAFSASATATIVMDMDSKRVIYSSNPHYVQTVASISKIMTAIVAIENGDLDKKVTAGKEVLAATGSSIYLQVGEKMTLKDLVYGLMMRSGNDSALTIAKAVAGSEKNFVELMNKKAKELEMNDTTFNNPHGLDLTEEGNYSSVYDMALLMSYAMENPIFQKIEKTKSYKVKTNKNTYTWKSKNKLLFNYKYTTGGKTGYTPKAKKTLVTSASNNDLNLTVVTFQDRNDFKDHKALYEETFKQYKSYDILDKGVISILGEDYYKNNELYIKNSFKYPLTLGEKETLTLKFKLEKKRDFNNNDKVGIVEIQVSNKKVHSENIYVKKEKTKIDFFTKVKNFFTNNS